jgi:hypothetical protein
VAEQIHRAEEALLNEDFVHTLTRRTASSCVGREAWATVVARIISAKTRRTPPSHRVLTVISTMRRFSLVLLMTGLLGSALAAPASGAVTRKKSMWGPIEVNGVSQFPIYADLGVGLHQTHMSWAEVARQRPREPRNPADPAYAWPESIDRAVQGGAPYGIRVSLLVMGTPPWANGGRGPRWAPSRPQDFADFMEAAARRYPQVRHWMIWGEPTKSENFQPLKPDGGRKLRGAGLRAPHLYARMLDRSYVALKRVNRRNLVIGGNTFTVGTVTPLRWIQALRLPNGKPPRMDLFGHNPFSVRTPRLRQAPLGRGYADLSDLDELIRWLDRHWHGSTPGRRRLRVFISELSLPTGHANFEFNFFLREGTQADWLRRALQITKRLRRIYTLGYLGLYDDPLRADGMQVERGLIERSGRRKPAFEVFKRG